MVFCSVFVSYLSKFCENSFFSDCKVSNCFPRAGSTWYLFSGRVSWVNVQKIIPGRVMELRAAGRVGLWVKNSDPLPTLSRVWKRCCQKNIRKRFKSDFENDAHRHKQSCSKIRHCWLNLSFDRFFPEIPECCGLPEHQWLLRFKKPPNFGLLDFLQ